MNDHDAHRTKFHALLQEQVYHEFTNSHQYMAMAVYFDGNDLRQLATHFYAQGVEERNHAMMMVQYLLDRDVRVEISGADAVRNSFDTPRDALALALDQERAVTEQVSRLAAVARDEGDFLGEQFIQWFLREQVEEMSLMTSLLRVADRAGANLFDLEDFVAREIGAHRSSADAPAAAGGRLAG